MTRKDYELIARAFNEAQTYSHHAGNKDSFEFGLMHLALVLSNALKADNPRMDRDKFLAAAMGDMEWDGGG